MASIEPFLRVHNDAFDDEATRLMGEAFDAACALLGEISHVAREVVAERIIGAATLGERDKIRLRDAGLTGLNGRALGG